LIYAAGKETFWGRREKDVHPRNEVRKLKNIKREEDKNLPREKLREKKQRGRIRRGWPPRTN